VRKKGKTKALIDYLVRKKKEAANGFEDGFFFLRFKANSL